MKPVVSTGGPGIILSVLLAGLCLNMAASAVARGATLEFIEPTNNAVFSNLEEVPIKLRSFATNDVFPSAELFADGVKIADLSYCCALCPCAAPQIGQEMILQIPVPRNGTIPPPGNFRGWTNPPVGIHRLTAKSTGQQGTKVETAPIAVTVSDARLEAFRNTDGTLTLVIPQGSMTPGAFDLQASEDLRTWTRLGAFEPGNVAAFYFGIPMERAWRFYRSLYIPQP